jgi:hypothetical protein
MKPRVVILLPILLWLAIPLCGCDSSGNLRGRTSDISGQTPMQRFLPVTSSVVPGAPPLGSLALDTQTGLLCQTYAISKDKPEWATSLPRCIDLYTDTAKTIAIQRSASNLDKEIMNAVKEAKKPEKQK